MHLRLWVHEVMRVFGDRLTDDKDLEWLIGKLKGSVMDVFDKDFSDLMTHLDVDKTGVVDVDTMRRCVFGNFMDVDAGGDSGKPRLYEEVHNLDRPLTRPSHTPDTFLIP